MVDIGFARKCKKKIMLQKFESNDILIDFQKLKTIFLVVPMEH